MQQQIMQTQKQFVDLYRSSLRSMNEAMKASLENAERVQRQQLDLLRGAIEDSTRSAGQLGEMSNLDDLMQVQARIAGAQLQRTMEFWSSVWRAAGESQAAVISQMRSQAGELGQAAASQAANAGNQERQQQQHRRAAG